MGRGGRFGRYGEHKRFERLRQKRKNRLLAKDLKKPPSRKLSKYFKDPSKVEVKKSIDVGV
jgi:hypothetical protein